jgi:hypothetical protein
MQIGESVCPPAVSTDTEDKVLCDLCKKDKHPFADEMGNNIGSGQTLAKKIIPDTKDHKWYTVGRSLQAHHLICSEALDDDQWATVCRLFGYDINRKENGVMLPAKMPLACQLISPLHRGNHEAASADSLNYPSKVKQLTAKYKKKALSGGYCGNIGQLVKDLDSISADLCSKVDAFVYTLTSDGADYRLGGKGCGNNTSVSDPKEKSCDHKRLHGLQHNGGLLLPKTSPLQVGT